MRRFTLQLRIDNEAVAQTGSFDILQLETVKAVSIQAMRVTAEQHPDLATRCLSGALVFVDDGGTVVESLPVRDVLTVH